MVQVCSGDRSPLEMILRWRGVWFCAREGSGSALEWVLGLHWRRVWVCAGEGSALEEALCWRWELEVERLLAMDKTPPAGPAEGI